MSKKPISTSIVALRQEIEAILQETPGPEASVSLPAALEAITDHMETLIRAGRRGEVRQAAEYVIALLSLDLDFLRKAALLSLMVRLTGKRKFDPVAAHVLEKRATYATAQG